MKTLIIIFLAAVIVFHYFDIKPKNEIKYKKSIDTTQKVVNSIFEKLKK